MKLLSSKLLRRRPPVDVLLHESRRINSFTVGMGYLSMAVRGTGILVLTWTTVVLLGGFVSVLEKKDFWCLTAISFMQAAGISDASRHERIRTIPGSLKGIFLSVIPIIDTANKWKLALIGAHFVAVLVIVTLLAVILAPIFGLYIFGPFVPIWLALWRLGHRDYSNGNGDEGSANLQVALDVLYILVVIQGVLFYYMSIISLAGQAIVKIVLKAYKFGKWADRTVWEYIDQTWKGCSKDPSLGEERNLITYAMDMIKSESAERIVEGTRIVDSIIGELEESTQDGQVMFNWRDRLVGPRMQLKQLIVESASSDEIIQKFLQMLDTRSPYGGASKEMRKRAARIVGHIAGDIHLKRFPLGIQCVASLLDTFEEYYVLQPMQCEWLFDTCEQDWCQDAPYLRAADRKKDDKSTTDKRNREDGYKYLVLQGLRILWRLAANKDNCAIMVKSVGLVSKIMAPVTNDLVHNHGHDESYYSKVLQGSLRVMCRVGTTTPRGIGKRLLSKMDKIKLVATIECIFHCKDCDDSLKAKAIEMLSELYMDTSTGMKPNMSQQSFMSTLLDTFLKPSNPPEEASPGTGGQETVRKGCFSFPTACFSSSTEKKATDEDDDSRTRFQQDNFKAKAEKKLDIRETAAQALMRLSSGMKNSAMIILKVDDKIVTELTALLLSANKKETFRRVAAAVLLERCISYNVKDHVILTEANMTKDLFLKCQDKLKKSLVSKMSKVLQEIRHYYLMVAQEKQTGKQTYQLSYVVPTASDDIENQCNGSKGKGCWRGQSDTDKMEKSLDAQYSRLFIPAFMSLFVTLCETCIRQDQESALLFGAITTSAGDTTSVPQLLKLMVEINSDPTAYCLRMVKLISKIAISMMKYEGSYEEADLYSLMLSLSDACNSMSFVEASMCFGSSKDGMLRVRDSMLNLGEEQPIRTLMSHMKKARLAHPE